MIDSESESLLSIMSPTAPAPDRGRRWRHVSPSSESDEARPIPPVPWAAQRRRQPRAAPAESHVKPERASGRAEADSEAAWRPLWLSSSHDWWSLHRSSDGTASIPCVPAHLTRTWKSCVSRAQPGHYGCGRHVVKFQARRPPVTTVSRSHDFDSDKAADSHLSPARPVGHINK